MPGLQQPAPYDSLATVTQLVRTYLGDYVQNLPPLIAGIVSTNGAAVTWVSGEQFFFVQAGYPITINGVVYQVQSVNSNVSLTLTTSAGVQNAQAFSTLRPQGDIFADAQPYVLPTINAAWRLVQEKLDDRGHPRSEVEVVIPSLPVVTSLDPSSRQSISWTGFFDGTALENAPLLPQDFISPLRLWERQSAPAGTTNLTQFRPMHPAPNALRDSAKGSWSRYWDWRGDAIYFRGSMVGMDLKVRYSAYLADIVVNAQGFAFTPIPIMRVAKGLAYHAAAIFVEPRGGATVATSFMAKGDAAIDQITNAFTKLTQRASVSRRAWGMRGRRRGRTSLYY